MPVRARDGAGDLSIGAYVAVEGYTWWLAGAIYWLVMSGYLYLLMASDKRRSQRGSRRVPERRLFKLAWLGGAAGGWAAMRTFRHKTKHRSFAIGFPAITFAQLAAVLLLYVYVYS